MRALTKILSDLFFEDYVIAENEKKLPTCTLCERTAPIPLQLKSSTEHPKCVLILTVAQTPLLEKIAFIYRNAQLSTRVEAINKATLAVRKASGESNLITYAEKHGVAALTQLFNTVGLRTIQFYSSL